MQTVQKSVLPFNTQHDLVEVPEGLTLDQIVSFISPPNIRGTEVVTIVGDRLVPFEERQNLIPSANEIVAVKIIPEGGRTGKTIIAAVVTIASLVFAPYLAGYLSGTTASAISAGAATAGEMAIYGATLVGVGLVGSLASSMIASVPTQSYAGSQSIAESATQFIEGATNQILKFGVVPICLGTNRMFPPQAALPYTETKGTDQYVRQLFTYGYGDVILTNRRLGETVISEYEEVEIEPKLKSNLNEGTSIYSNDVFQEGLSIVLAQADGFTTITTQQDANEFELDITFGSGLAVFNSDGSRSNRTVDFEIQFAPTGTTDWSVGVAQVTVATQNLNIPDYSIGYFGSEVLVPVAFDNKGIVLLNRFTGATQIQSYTDTTEIPGTPYTPAEGWIRIASYEWDTDLGTVSLIDERAPYIGSTIIGSTSFEPSVVGSVLTLAAGDLANNFLRVTDNTTQALRVSNRTSFPAVGQYDVRIRRITTDSVSDLIRDEATLTALKSIKDIAPVTKSDISGEAMRIRGTDQLNGAVDRYNSIVSLIVKRYDSTSETWVDGTSSNPAAIYRHVLQSPAFVLALPDSLIDLEKLEEWSLYCEENNFSYNRVIDYDASIDDILNDVAAAGMATKHNVNGKYSVIIDNERPIVKGLVTLRNSWSYKGNINYPEVPHALRVQFRNADKDYALDEVIVYSDGYDEFTATEFETLEFSSCTNADLAYFYGARYIATLILQPETHTFYQDWENLTYERGDRISFVNDCVLVGVGQGRIKTLIDDGTYVTGFTIDDEIEIPTADNFATRIRYGDGSEFTYHQLDTVIGTTDTLTFTTPVLIADAPPVGSLCSFVEDGKELDLIITNIERSKSEKARITAINYAPERFEPLGEIPAFESNVTLPAGFYRPEAPVLSEDIQSDESVMLRNSDGSYTPRMLIFMTNRNEPSVGVSVRIKPQGATQWGKANILSSSPELLVLTGLSDGKLYDIEVRYQRQAGQQLLSKPLVLNSIKFVGASTVPNDVEGFEVTSSGTVGLFKWLQNDDIDLDHYVMRFSNLTSGALYQNAQLLEDNIVTNRISLPIQKGTYFIKAVDILGNESENAAVIISIDEGALSNVVQTLTQDPTWGGVKTNCVVDAGDLIMVDPTQVAYYYFTPDPYDLTEVYESFVSSAIEATLDSVSGAPSGLVIRDQTSIRSLASVRGFDGVEWSVTLEINYSDDNVTWSGWETFSTGKYIFRYVRLRLAITSSDQYVTPRISTTEVTIDMPDRSEHGENINCDATLGTTITYDVPFKESPAVNITLQDGEVDDKIVYSSKTNTGFSFTVYNATAAGNVTRTYDYDSAGFGRLIS